MKRIHNHQEEKEKKVYLTLDLEKDYGTALKNDQFFALENCKDLIKLLEKYKIPLTIFIQTKILEKDILPECLLNSEIKIEYGVHSHSHKIGNGINYHNEIKLSTDMFTSFFNRRPLGYRAPDGVICTSYLNEIKKFGYLYDSSFTPSWRFKRFTNKPVKTKPFLTNCGLLEIPFSVCSNLFAIPISLSYFKLIGNVYQRLYLTKSENSRIVFNIHLHDLKNPKNSFSKLPYSYKIIYLRNNNFGFDILKKILLTFLKQGVKFDILSNYAKELLQKYQKIIKVKTKSPIHNYLLI
jgi:peptidoglycan/xylan/chitin deacetylase (PgdA/CDA1 family)